LVTEVSVVVAVYLRRSFHTIITAPPTSFSGAVAGEEEDFCKGSFAHTSFTLF
jgi:hypothetical protein